MMMMMPDNADNGLPAGWVASRRGGWHNPDCAGAGYTGIIKPHRTGRSWGWAVFGAGQRQIAGWLNAQSPGQAAAAAERAAIAAAAELAGVGQPPPARRAGLAALGWCSVCGRDLARLRYCYGRMDGGGGLVAYCPRCYR